MSTTPTPTEDTPAHLLQPGGRRMAHVVTALLAGVVVAALGAGVPALAWAGRLAGLAGWAPYLVVAIIDGAMVVLSLAAVTRRGRGERAKWMWVSTGILVVASAAVQCMHALTVTSAGTLPTRIVAAAVGSTPPAIVLLATHAWLDLAVAGAPTKARRAAQTARPARTATLPVSTPAAMAPAPALPTGTAPVLTDAPAARPTPARDGLTRADVVALAAPLRDEGLSYQVIANRLGLSKTRVVRALTSENVDSAVGAAA